MSDRPFRVIITGDRNWSCTQLAYQIVERLKARHGKGLTLIHGAASGVDMAFDVAAVLQGVTKEPHPAEWGRTDAPGAIVRRRRDGTPYNANAGPQRNAEMVKLGANLCLAVHRDIASSRGTKSCAKLAIAAGIPTWLVSDESGVPERLRERDARLQR